MNLNWINQPFAMYAAVAAGSAAALHLFLSSKVELRRQSLRHEDEVGKLRQSLGDLESRLAAIATEAERDARLQAAVVAPLPSGLNLSKRSEALRMCRRGADPQTIAGRLGLSRAEALLLGKVHQHLADVPAAQFSGLFQDRSRRLEYSREA